MSIKNVVDGGFCIGCGACKSVVPEIKIVFNRYGDLVAELPAGISDEALARGTAVCPFAGGNETQMAAELFNDVHVEQHAEVGRHLGRYAAFAPQTRDSGSSGGIATWLLSSLLQRGLIDHAIHVGPSSERPDGRFFSYRISTTAGEVQRGSTSFYYPVSMDEVLERIRATPGRYAITAIPCFNKALRRLRSSDPVLDERIVYQVGIVCGQMKSAHYLDYLTRVAGGDTRPVDACFRRKVPGHRADDYAFEATLAAPGGATSRVTVMNSRIGVNWGMGYFKPLACDYCDDVMAETADIAVMDAWLPKYVSDGRGWSFVVTRSLALDGLVREASDSGELVSEPVDIAAVVQSQRGGLNHRRDALPYRLWLGRRRWQPGKRLEASPKLAWANKAEQRLRSYLRQRSRELWLRTGFHGDLAAFSEGMRFGEFAHRLISKIKRLMR